MFTLVDGDVMAKPRFSIGLTAGAINELPQLHNPSVATRGTLRLLLATEPHEETDTLRGSQSKGATMVAFDLSLNDAIRLAVEISEIAQVRGAPLPKGVLYRGSTH
jgi:hypothetical protein